MILARRLPSIRIASTLLLVAAGLTLVEGTPAIALPSRTVSMTQLASTVVSGATNTGAMVIDSVHKRGYVIAYPTSTLEVFDVSGAGLTHIASIGPIEAPAQVALSEATNQVVVVGGIRSGTLTVVDADPASPTVDTIVARIITGNSGGATNVAVSRAATAYVVHNTGSVYSIVDLRSETVKNIPIASGVDDVAVDRRTGIAYVPDYFGHSIRVVLPTGEVSAMSIGPDFPRSVEVANGSLLVGVETPGAVPRNLVESLDLHTWARTATSAEIPSKALALVVDEDLRLVYVGADNSGAPVVRALRLGSLESQFASAPSAGHSYLALDRSTHRLYASQSTSMITSYSVEVAPQRGVERIGGADRFEVSASIPADSFAPGVPVAYLASGLGFADALSGSASAGAEGGPVLLTGRDSVPGVVLRELIRLKPQRIVVLGGPASVSQSVIDTVSAVASTTRIAGADRFEVSAGVSAATFKPGLPVAYVASGSVFADALSGSAAAGRNDAPVLLTLKDSVPRSVDDELRRLHPGAIVVLGGVNSVSDTVLSSLGSIAPATRIAGEDRFVVSAAVSAKTFIDGARTAYVASGAVFPDALSGSAAAIESLAPVLLATRDAVPPAVLAEIDRLKPTRIVLLGGPNSVSDSVKTVLESHLAP